MKIAGMAKYCSCYFYDYIIVMNGGIVYMKTYGYVRVSSREQNEDRQLIALKEIGLILKYP